MKACLLYQEKEWANEGHYFEEGAVMRDLGLDTLFWAASRDVIRDEEEKDRIIALGDPDAFLERDRKSVV